MSKNEVTINYSYLNLIECSIYNVSVKIMQFGTDLGS